MTSGSASWTKSRQLCSNFRSSSKEITWEPTIFEHEFRVKTLRMKGFCSPIKASKLGCERDNCRFTLTCDHVSDLDYGILTSLRKYAFATRTLDIETQDTKWGNFGPLALSRM